MIVAANEREPWQSQAKCKKLSPTEADEIFFVGPGKKSKAAKTFCSSCVVQGSCLVDALKNDLEGFFSGTTETERRAMAKMQNMIMEKLNIPEPEVKATKSKYLHIVKAPDPRSWMDEVEPTEDELLSLVGA